MHIRDQALWSLNEEGPREIDHPFAFTSVFSKNAARYYFMLKDEHQSGFGSLWDTRY